VSTEQRPPRKREQALPDDQLVLAAVQRAALHRGVEPLAAPIWAILAHLALARRSAAARHVRARLHVLADAGELSSARRHGVTLWALTRQGERRLRRARDAGELSVLPESPQHQAWRNARVSARAEIGRCRRRLHELIDRAGALLDAEQPPDSDAWLELGEELRGACRRLGSASHCLYEWQEPDDAVADIDRHEDPAGAREAAGDSERERLALARRRAMRVGRRNIGLWREDRGR
jgi:hypothetical protein